MEDFNKEDLQIDAVYEEESQSHTDKLAGLFTEPGKMFENAAKFPPKFIDWFLPVMFTGLMVFVTLFLLNSNPNIKEQFRQKQIQQIERSVEQGKLSEEQAEKAIENFEKFDSPLFVFISGISGFIGMFVIFFLVALIYYLFARYAFKDNGNYSSAMVASGLPYYIFLIGAIVTLIYSLVTENFAQSFSVGQLLKMDATTFAGFWMHKIEPFSIWALIVTSIGLSKIFHSNDTKKYYFLVFGLWIGWAIIQYFLTKAFGMF